MARFGLIEDYDYNATHKRKRFTIWSGPFASVREGEMYSLPNGKGFMITLEYGHKIRVECPVERTDTTYIEQDKAINDALNAYYDEHYGPSLVPETPTERLEYLRRQINAERISTAELIELQGMVDHIEPGDVQLLEWAGVPEFEEEPEYSPNGKPVIRKR